MTRDFRPLLQRLCALLVALVTSTSGQVLALPSNPEAAYLRYEEGEAAFAEKRFDDAATAFGAAFELHAEPAYLYNQGLALGWAEKLAAAIAVFEVFLVRFAAEPRAAEVSRRLSELKKRRQDARATILVNTIPGGAMVRIAGSEDLTCQSPCELEVDPGVVALEVELNGKKRRETRELSARERWSVGYDLSPAPGAAASAHVGSWLSFGVGATALVVGTVFAIAAQGSYDEGHRLADASPLDGEDYGRLSDLRKEVRTQSLVADTSFGIALTGALLGAVLWFLDDDADDRGGVPGAASTRQINKAAFHF